MSLSQSQIAALMAKDQARRTNNKTATGRTSTGKKVDTTNRDYKTWFALAHKMLDEETQEHLKCENPNCVDPRPRAPVVAMVSGKHMCRYCFLAGWLLVDTEQLQLSE